MWHRSCEWLASHPECFNPTSPVTGWARSWCGWDGNYKALSAPAGDRNLTAQPASSYHECEHAAQINYTYIKTVSSEISELVFPYSEEYCVRWRVDSPQRQGHHYHCPINQVTTVNHFSATKREKYCGNQVAPQWFSLSNLITGRTVREEATASDIYWLFIATSETKRLARRIRCG